MKLKEFKELVRKLPKQWDELEVVAEGDAGYYTVGEIEVESHIDKSVVIITPEVK